MLHVENVSIRIHKKDILKEISIELKEGEVVALCGPNGAGKSTLLRAISGEIIPTEGRVFIKEKDIKEWQPLHLAQQRAKLSQESHLSFAFLAKEVVEMGRFPYPETKENDSIVDDSMRLVGIEHLSKRQYTSLSGGEKQRVHLARVLAQLHSDLETSKLMLLDEPTSALDVLHQEVVLEIAHQLAKEKNYVVLVVLHDLNLAAAWADRIVLLKDGLYKYDGAPKEILTPDILQEIYEIQCLVLEHPKTGRPIITIDRETTIHSS
jgi:iron complex transport system ATP-binding protein